MIEWRNDNQGFLTAILAILSLFISCIAVWVSIGTARLSYKKKVKLMCYKFFAFNKGQARRVCYPLSCSDFQQELPLIGFGVSVTNIGHAPINVSLIGFRIEKITIFNRGTILDCKKVLHPTESVYMDFDKKNIKVDMQHYNPKTKVYVYMDDSEGNKYKQYCGQVQDFICLCVPNDKVNRRRS